MGTHKGEEIAKGCQYYLKEECPGDAECPPGARCRKQEYTGNSRKGC